MQSKRMINDVNSDMNSSDDDDDDDVPIRRLKHRRFSMMTKVQPNLNKRG